MLAIHNSWARAEHRVIYTDPAKDLFFDKLPFDVAPTPNEATIFRLWRGILSFLYEKKLDPSVENTIYINDLKNYTGHNTKDNRALIEQLPWLKYLTIVSDEIINQEHWVKARSPVTTIGFNKNNRSVFSIQLHSDCRAMFGFVEGGNYTVIDPLFSKGLKSKGMMEFYERCVSYAFFKKSWNAKRDELLRMFNFTQAENPKQYGIYKEWRMLRRILTKKAKQLERAGLRVEIEKIHPKHKDQAGVVTIVPFQIDKKIEIIREPAKSKSVKTESTIYEPEANRHALLDLVEKVDKQTRDRINGYLAQYDSSVVHRICNRLCPLYFYQNGELYFRSKKHGAQQKTIGHLYNAIKNMTKDDAIKKSTRTLKTSDRKRTKMEQVKYISIHYYIEQLNDWSKNTPVDSKLSEHSISTVIQKNSVLSLLPHAIAQFLARVDMTDAEETLLKNLGSSDRNSAIDKIRQSLTSRIESANDYYKFSTTKKSAIECYEKMVIELAEQLKTDESESQINQEASQAALGRKEGPMFDAAKRRLIIKETNVEPKIHRILKTKNKEDAVTWLHNLASFLAASSQP